MRPPRSASVSSLAEIDRATWDGCANPLSRERQRRARSIPSLPGIFCRRWRNPDASAGEAAGPRGTWFWKQDGIQTGFMPCYVKGHSQGEYVFDWGWAEALRARRRRLLSEAAGLRAVHAGDRAAASRRRRPGGSRAASGAGGRAGGNLPASRSFLRACDLPRRGGPIGAGGARLSCSAPTSSSTGRTRAMATSRVFSVRLRHANARRSAASGATRSPRASRSPGCRGAEISEAALGRLLRFLHGHRVAQMGPALSQPQLLLAARRAPRRRMCSSSWRGETDAAIAGALNLVGSDTLYGRYWGCVEDRPFLHFEVCYYQAIDFALAHGLTRVEAGAQGAHKLARGYLPHTTHSAHYIVDPGFPPRGRELSLPRSGCRSRRRDRLSPPWRRSGAATSSIRRSTPTLTGARPAERVADFLWRMRMNATAYDDSNVFAKILRGELPSRKGLRGRAHGRDHGRDAARRRPCARPAEGGVAKPPRHRHQGSGRADAARCRRWRARWSRRSTRTA